MFVLVVALPIAFRFALYVPLVAEVTKPFRGLPGNVEPPRPAVLAAIRVVAGLLIAGVLFLIVRSMMHVEPGAASTAWWRVFTAHGFAILLVERIAAWYVLFNWFVIARGDKVPWGTIALCTFVSFLIDVPIVIVGTITGLAFFAQGMGSC